MKLRNVEILKYKCYTENQSFQVKNGITILVGMNESGKTAALEAIAKTNYFQDDKDFVFNDTYDYPRREKKKMDKSGAVPEAIVCTYELDESEKSEIEDDLGKDTLESGSFYVTTKYDNKGYWNGLKINRTKFIESQTDKLGISSEALNEKLMKIASIDKLKSLIEEYKDEKYMEALPKLNKYYENEWGWKDDPISEYVARVYLKPNKPKFLYYDEYFSLPARINIEKLESNSLDKNEYKTAKALFDLADINTTEILKADSFENFIAELEATEAIISEELFHYWKTNKNLNITFKIDKKEGTDNRNNTKIVEHILDIRVRNKGVSLSLKNRSKGFNWFFSFLVWFKKIQEDASSQYVLLLDEPGLNLHASAQADLLEFLEDLSENYQIIYTTHSPFMIPSESLDRVRTVFEDKETSIISEGAQEKDPNTLFPLQAALGYDIAQNLFISKKNLLVEGVSDLIILTAMSDILEANNKEGLRNDITIVPTGGLEKVATFISLLRGSKLEIACLLDSYTDAKGEAKMDKMISDKIINKSKVHFFDEFLEGYNQADLEDLFYKDDYLKLFNSAFPEYDNLKASDLNSEIKPIIIQLNQKINKSRFNHYKPANELIKSNFQLSDFNETTIEHFEKVFQKANSLFS